MARSTRLSTRLRRAPTQYVPIARLAAGGMAEVWRADAVFEDGGRHAVAIKRVLPKLAQNPLYRSMFEDEARLGTLLRHQCVVRVYDAREVAGTYIMIMELVDGTSLKALLDKAHERAACMPVPTALYVAKRVAEALDYAHLAADAKGTHLGIIHRDVSPHNVLLGRAGHVKLTDFGLANASVHQTMRSSELVGGKLGYLAPEVVLQKAADHRIDLFALGIVLWEMLAGQRLFQSTSDTTTVRNVVRMEIPRVGQINPSSNARVDALVERALSRNPDERFRSARQLIEAIDECLSEIDPDVGARDVELLVGLYLARIEAEVPTASGLERVAGELEAFVRAAGDADYDLGAQPLDPSTFEVIGRSGVRPMPAEEDDAGDWYDPED